LENNVNFNRDLRIFYLSSLAERDEKQEFMKFYHSVEGYLEDLISNSTNLEILNRVKNIISYRTKILEKNL
jgi:hypothetical protein